MWSLEGIHVPGWWWRGRLLSAGWGRPGRTLCRHASDGNFPRDVNDRKKWNTALQWRRIIIIISLCLLTALGNWQWDIICLISGTTGTLTHPYNIVIGFIATPGKKKSIDTPGKLPYSYNKWPPKPLCPTPKLTLSAWWSTLREGYSWLRTQQWGRRHGAGAG